MPRPLAALLAAVALLPGPVLAAQSAPVASAAWADAIARGRTAVRALVDTGATPGVAVAVAVRGKIVWAEGFGWADAERRVRAARDTPFGIGSISKSLTMAAALALVDAGRLELDAPVRERLPDFPHAGVTLRQVGAHQSGLSDDFATARYRDTVHFPSVDSAYRLVAREHALHAPGADTVYATGLFAIVARAIEVADGRAYADVVRARVLEPAGMRATVPNDPRAPPPGRAAFYERSADGRFVPAPYYDPSHKLPGAGWLASAEDLARFGAALLRGDVLSPAAREELFRPVPLADGRPTRFALGFRVSDDGGRRLLHQPGGGIGISSWLFLYPEEELVVALVANVATAPVGGVTRRAITAAFLERMAAPAVRNGQ